MTVGVLHAGVIYAAGVGLIVRKMRDSPQFVPPGYTFSCSNAGFSVSDVTDRQDGY